MKKPTTQTASGRWRFSARLVVSSALGAIAAYGLAPWGIWPLTLLMLLAVPALFGGATSTRQAVLIGWALGIGWFASGLVWIVEPFLVDAARFGWMAPFAISLMALGGGAFWALAFGLAYRFAHTGLARILALILTWSVIEFARAYLFTGFPWAAFAQIWPGTDVALLLAWIGPHGLALATLLATMLPGWALFAGPKIPSKLVSTVPALILIAGSFSVGQSQPETATSSGNTIRLIQPNAPQDQKWDPNFTRIFFERQLEFTAAGPRPDLVVWPESAVPVMLANAESVFERITQAAAGTPVVLGIQRRDDARYFNSLVYLNAQGQVAGQYDKHHLVPFGEYIPFGDLAARFGLRGFAAQEGNGFSAGPGPEILDLGTLGRALPLICYEAVFPQNATVAGERPDYLLQITNDAWFGTKSGPYQHLAQARMRAIEQGLPLIRAANTGISAMIDPWGRITAEIPLGEAGFVDAVLPISRDRTLYARTGDAPVFLLLLLAGFGLWGVHSRRNTSI